jgi:glyoxylase-like metal-dependent hydrolase (beta-lactamase superfamily II)
MIVQDAGFIAEEILLLGSRSICMYLVRGESYALLGGGVPWVVHRLESQLEQYEVDRSRIRYLVISHAHHDHCGAVPYLLRRYPHMEIIASDYCAHLLNKSKPVELMRSLNRQTLDHMKRPHHYDGTSLDFEPIPVSTRVSDGDCLDLGGGITLQFYLTPGHSRCSMSTYVPAIHGLFPADALPFPENDDKLIVTANHDYDDYIRSLEKLQELSIALIGYEHGGTLTGEDAATIIPRSLAATVQQRERIRERYDELKDLDPLVDEIAGKYQSLQLFSMVPPALLRAIINRMVRSALGMV